MRSMMKRALVAAAVVLCAAGAVWGESRVTFFWSQGKEFVWNDFPPVDESLADTSLYSSMNAKEH